MFRLGNNKFKDLGVGEGNGEFETLRSRRGRNSAMEGRIVAVT